jgi:hypothetical protein
LMLCSRLLPITETMMSMWWIRNSGSSKYRTEMVYQISIILFSNRNYKSKIPILIGKKFSTSFAISSLPVIYKLPVPVPYFYFYQEKFFFHFLSPWIRIHQIF